MANISDPAGIFVGPTLDLFNQMEAAVLRDGDVVGAQQELQVAMTRVTTTQTNVSGTGQTKKHRQGS